MPEEHLAHGEQPRNKGAEGNDRPFHERARTWILAAWKAARGERESAVVRPALTIFVVLTGLFLAIAVGIGLVLVVYRAGDVISQAFMGTAPLAGRILGYVFTAAVLVGSAFFMLALLALGGWLAARALNALRGEAAPKLSSQSERYFTGAIMALVLIVAGAFVFTQPGFQTLPLELQHFLVPLVLPFALGAVAAPTWGRGPALTLTFLALFAIAAIVVGVGYLEPASAAGPSRVFEHWADLMRQTSAIQRIWWMLVALIAVLVWTVAVFVGFREPRVRGSAAAMQTAMQPTQTVLVPAPDPWLREPKQERTPAPAAQEEALPKALF